MVRPPEEVDRLTVVPSSAVKVIFDSPSMPDAHGEVERMVEVAGRPASRPAAPERGAQVTVQVVLEADGAAFAGREKGGGGAGGGGAVGRTLAALPHARWASSPVVPLWCLPAARE
ncbi:hypothetical protein [Streptomyces sp.]|uniref:hypothetical protein n=1 Tax=Streptomyces sp. TaxID=1931 RepID=UPI002811C825|nr:hypothetical protein [Streptomyces sp.]